MFIKPQEEMTPAQAAPTWEALCKEEYKLKRKLFLSRLLPPAGSLIFMIHLMLAAMNFLSFGLPEKFHSFYEAIPVLPKLAAPLAVTQGSWGSMIFFVIWFCFLIPLAVCGLIFGGKYFWDRYKNPYHFEPLAGDDAHCAKMLARKAENLYILRRRFLHWSVFAEAAVAAGVVALTAFIACLRMAADGSVLELAAALFALLVSIFVLYWIFAGLFALFILLVQVIFFPVPSPWKYWDQYQRLDAYWESADPAQHALREQKAQLAREKHWWDIFRKVPAQEELPPEELPPQ